MSGAAPPRLALRAGLGALLLLLALLLLWPTARRALAAGWLVALLFWLGIALGALALLAVHALTGGRWGGALRPALAPAAASLPLFLLLALPLLAEPLLAGPGGLYPWAAPPWQASHDGLAQWYLNRPSFLLRGLVALALWSALALLLLRMRPGGPRRLVAALGLVFHLAATTLLGFDWVLALRPDFQSSAFGMAMLLLQLLSALGWAVWLRPAPGDTAADLGGLLLAAVLGSLYLGFSQYLVIWYGDLPDKIAWYLLRWQAAWVWLEALSLLLSGLLPLLVLLPGGWRRSPSVLARMAPWLLGGILLHHAWLVAPEAGPWSLPAALLAMLAIGGLWFGLAYGPLAARLGRAG